MSETAGAPGRVARFGRFDLDVRTGELRKGGRKVRLQDQPFQILLLLLERPGDLVTRDMVRQRLWPADTFVDFDQGLNNAVRRLRDALGDSADEPTYVETLPRLGYRFIAAIEWLADLPATAAPAAIHVAAASIDATVTTDRFDIDRRTRRRLLTAACMVVAGALAYGTWTQIDRRSVAAPGRIMLAVLPFQNLGDESGQDYLSDGLTEEMISQLGALAPDRLGVLARTSAMQYKKVTKSAGEIGQELGVAYLLEGSVRRSGDRVRITARLVEVADQTPRWSHAYETDLVDVLTIQKDVARAIADEMRIQLSPERLARISDRRRVDPLAYELYLRGRQAWNRRTAAGLREAVADFERALGKDPLSADAYAGLADAYGLLSLYDDIPPRQVFPRAKAAALKALELEPNRGDAYTSLAYIAHRFEWDWIAAEHAYRRALELNPSYATAHHWYAEFLMVRGRLDEARTELETAQRLDPLSPRIALDVSLPDYFAGDYQRAIEQARDITKLHPDFVPAWVALRQYCERQGRYEDAIAALRQNAAALGLPSTEADTVAVAYRSSGPTGYWQRLLELADDGWPTSQTPAHRANMYAAIGNIDRALFWLERAFTERDDEIVWIAVEPWYEPLRGDARFTDLLARIGLRV
jgi:TolB-like protein/DNA-binding winged helix-turn-helix (wHTH) protein/predicted Zn-dependent protease